MMMKSCIRPRPVLYDEIALIDEEIGSMVTNIPSIDYSDDLHGKQANLLFTATTTRYYCITKKESAYR